jgi:LysM repeat protein
MPETDMSRSLAFALLFAVSASLAAGPPAPAAGGCGGSYVVTRGDTLYSIARRCHSTVVAIAGASGLADPRRIEIGERLVIPGFDAPGAPEDAKPEPAPPTTVSYSFRPGDTLYSLARWARISVPGLLAANPGINPNKVEIGDAVRLPAGAVSPEPARLRERGTGPGPAFVLRPPWVRVRESVPVAPPPAPPPRPHSHQPPPPPVRVHEDHPRPAPAPPRRDKPDGEDERAPEGM